MNEEAKSSWLLAATTLAAGVLGGIFSPDLFRFGFDVDGMITVQILFFGLILFGLYTEVGEILRERGVRQSPSTQVPGRASPETAGANARELQEPFYWKLWDHAWFVTLLIGGVLTIVLMLGIYESITQSLLASSSFVAGFYCTVAIPFLRVGRTIRNNTITNSSYSVLVLTIVVWVLAQRVAYLLIFGDLALVGYINLARLSSVFLLASAALGLLQLGLFTYFSRRRYVRTMEQGQIPA